MALKPVLLLLLWNLTFFVHGVTSVCHVTCSTDYQSSLNCSCSGSVPTHPVRLEVKCREWSGDLEVEGICEITPPQSWCVMYPEMFDDVTSIGTTCTATGKHVNQVITSPIESSRWNLSNVVKPLPPFDVQVTNNEGLYNITWDHDNQQDCLMYMVRVRESNDLSKDPALSLTVENMHTLVLGHNKLQPHVNYTVDVKAKMCPNNLYKGPWSEWSVTAEWRNTEPAGPPGPPGPEVIAAIGWKDWRYIVLTIVPVLGLVVWLGCSKKTYLQKKFRLITYIPKPDDYFKPLYIKHGGNFKEWVKPVFSEYDYLKINSQAQMNSEKQHDILQWSNEKEGLREDNEMKQGGHLLHMLQPHSNSLLFFQDGGSSQGTGHSTGHISIHTVTLSGEEEFEEEVTSQSSANTLRSYQGGESFGSFGEVSREQAGYGVEGPQMSRMDRQSGVLPLHENQISNNLSLENINFQPRVLLNEPERVSLDSFASNEQSEDGYPHVDLDTIDSGFGECSSPGASDSNIAEQIDSDSFHQHKNLNSNYVKQWMVCSTIHEDCSSSENEFHETQ